MIPSVAGTSTDASAQTRVFSERDVLRDATRVIVVAVTFWLETLKLWATAQES